MKNKNRRYYLLINKQLVEVNEQVYKAYYRPIWRARYHAQKNGECRCTKAQLWLCDGDCTVCRFHSAGKTVYLDASIGGDDSGLTVGDTITDGVQIDDALIEQEQYAALYAALDRLDPDDRRICVLIMQGSEREAARRSGMARSTFKHRWEKIKEELKDKLKDFYY